MDTCASCGSAVEPWQDYCLECGERIVRPQGVVATLGRGWRRRLGGYPGDWIWPSLATLAVAAAGAAGAIAATGGTEADAPHTLTATSPLVEPSRRVAASPGSRVLTWPQEDGYTVVLGTYPVPDGGAAARRR